RLAAGHIGAKCLRDVRRHREIKTMHDLDEGAAVAFLQPRILGQLLTDGRMRASLVFMRRKDFQCRIEPQYAFEQAFVERPCIATGQVGAPRSTDEERIAGKYAILDTQAHGIARVAGRVERLYPQLSDD